MKSAGLSYISDSNDNQKAMHEENFQQNWLHQSPAHFHKKSEKGKHTFVNRDICQIIDAAHLTPISSRHCVSQFTVQRWDGTLQTPCGTRVPQCSRMKGRMTHARIQDFQRGVVNVDSCCLVLPDRIFLENQKDGIPKLFRSFSSHPYLFLLQNHKLNLLKGGFHDLEHAGGASMLTMRGIMRVSL